MEEGFDNEGEEEEKIRIEVNSGEDSGSLGNSKKLRIGDNPYSSVRNDTLAQRKDNFEQRMVRKEKRGGRRF